MIPLQIRKNRQKEAFEKSRDLTRMGLWRLVAYGKIFVGKSEDFYQGNQRKKLWFSELKFEKEYERYKKKEGEGKRIEITFLKILFDSNWFSSRVFWRKNFFLKKCLILRRFSKSLSLFREASPNNAIYDEITYFADLERKQEMMIFWGPCFEQKKSPK